MTDTNASPAPEITGQMYLYDKVEPLSLDDHAGLGLVEVAQPYAFASEARLLPLTMTELRTAQRHYPIVFTAAEKATPVAVVGIEDHNLFLDANRDWQPGTYVPAYLRCYPFALATAGNNQAVVFDRNASCVSDSPDTPFFEGSDLSEGAKRLVSFCRSYDAERQNTIAFCDRLSSLGLLQPQTVTQTLGEETKDIVTFFAVDPERLQALTPETIHELFGNGMLSAINAHLFSLDNFQGLLQRHAEHTGLV